MEESGWRNHGGTMASRRIQEPSQRHPGGTQEAPRGQPGGTQEAPRRGSGRHLGDLRLRGDFGSTCLNFLIDVCSRLLKNARE